MTQSRAEWQIAVFLLCLDDGISDVRLAREGGRPFRVRHVPRVALLAARVAAARARHAPCGLLPRRGRQAALPQRRRDRASRRPHVFAARCVSLVPVPSHSHTRFRVFDRCQLQHQIDYEDCIRSMWASGTEELY